MAEVLLSQNEDGWTSRVPLAYGIARPGTSRGSPGVKDVKGR